MDNSSIIFSTKGLYTKEDTLGPLVIYIVCCVLFGIALWDYLSSLFGMVIFCVLAMFCVIPFWRAQQMKKSYIDLYEGCVVGYSVPQNYFSLSAGACEFKLDYAQITHLDIQKDIVKIYFNGGNYWVQAKGAENKVVEIIKSKISIV